MTDATVGRPIPGPNGMDARLDPDRATKDEIGYWGGKIPIRRASRFPWSSMVLMAVAVGVVFGLLGGGVVVVTVRYHQHLTSLHNSSATVAPAQTAREAVHQVSPPLPVQLLKAEANAQLFREFDAYRKGMEAASDALFRQRQSR